MRAFLPEPDLSERIHDAVLEAICSGELKAGTRLTQEELAQRFGVSRQPVLQAMMLLRREGFPQVNFPLVLVSGVYNGDANLSAYPAKCRTDGGYCSALWNGGTGYPDWASPAVVDSASLNLASGSLPPSGCG